MSFTWNVNMKTWSTGKEGDVTSESNYHSLIENINCASINASCQISYTDVKKTLEGKVIGAYSSSRILPSPTTYWFPRRNLYRRTPMCLH